jgi:hypothetical protein
MLISIESILDILFLEKYFFLKFYQYSQHLPLGRVLVMSDGKCKSSFISPSVVLNATMEQVLIGGKQFQRWARANFCLK